jgi:hypothetical protein
LTPAFFGNAAPLTREIKLHDEINNVSFDFLEAEQEEIADSSVKTSNFLRR